jgi:hypothetical protein
VKKPKQKKVLKPAKKPGKKKKPAKKKARRRQAPSMTLTGERDRALGSENQGRL